MNLFALNDIILYMNIIPKKEPSFSNNNLDINYFETIVSIIMPCFNSSLTIRESIDSVLKQSFSKWELIIVDDCSADSSFLIVSEYAKNDTRIKLFKTSKRSGAAIARNIAIKKAKGRFIAFLDSDDLWEKEKLQKQIDFMIKKDISFSYSDYYVLYPNGQKKIYKVKDKVNYKKLLKNNLIGCLTAIYDTEKIGKIYMPVDALKREDFAAWLFILHNVKYAYKTKGVLATYRISSTSVSSRKIRMIKYQWNVYRKIENISIFKSSFLLIAYIFNKSFLKYK